MGEQKRTTITDKPIYSKRTTFSFNKGFSLVKKIEIDISMTINQNQCIL